MTIITRNSAGLAVPPSHEQVCSCFPLCIFCGIVLLQMGKADFWGTVNSFYDLYFDDSYIYQIAIAINIDPGHSCPLSVRFLALCCKDFGCSSNTWDLEGGEVRWSVSTQSSLSEVAVLFILIFFFQNTGVEVKSPVCTAGRWSAFLQRRGAGSVHGARVELGLGTSSARSQLLCLQSSPSQRRDRGSPQPGALP